MCRGGDFRNLFIPANLGKGTDGPPQVLTQKKDKWSFGAGLGGGAQGQGFLPKKEMGGATWEPQEGPTSFLLCQPPP